MRKSTRILAFCLTFLMVVGMLPLSLFAIGGSGDSSWTYETKNDATTTPGASTLAGITKAAIAESITVNGGTLVAFETFDGWPEKPGTGAPSDDIGEYKNASQSFSVVDLGNGNKALRYGAGAAGSKDYDTYFGAKPVSTAGADFVYQFDVRCAREILVDNSGYKPLFALGTRDTANVVKASPTQSQLLYIDKYGNLYPTNGNNGPLTTDKIGNLNADSFTTVAIYGDVSENKLYYYINGRNVNAEGYTFLSDAWLTAQIKADVLEGGWSSNNFAPQFTRFYQVQNKVNPANTLDIDNVLTYTTTRGYLGVKGDGETAVTCGTNGLYKDPTTGYYCYLVDGCRQVNTTIDGIYYNDEGWASKAERVSAVNWDKSFDSSSTDKLRDSITARSTAKLKKSLSDYTYLIADVGFKYGARSAAGFVPFSNDGKVWAQYDDIEYNFRTPSIQNFTVTLQIVVPDNDNPDANNKGKNYASYEMAFGDDIVGTYYALAKALGGDKNLGTTRTWNLPGLHAIGWTTYTKSLASWGWRNGGFDWDDGTVTNVAFQFTGWNAALNCTDPEGTQMAFNCDDAEIEIASINLVKYTPTANFNELIYEANGDKVPVGGFITGWYVADSGNKYYFPAYSHTLAKNKVCEIYDYETESFLTYAFDATGKCTGLANGVATSEDGNTRYFVNGVYKTANFRDVDGTEYEILPNGKITGNYFDVYQYDNDFSNVPVHSGGSYTMAATFEDKVVGRADSGPLITGNSSPTIAGSGTPRAQLIDKCSVCDFVDVGGTNGKALRIYNAVNSVDTYINVWLPDISAKLNENIIVEYETMIGEDWSFDNFNFLQIIDRNSGGGTGISFQGLLSLNSDGYVKLACGSKNGTPLFKLSTTEFTRMSAVIHPAAKTMDIYCNGVKLIENYTFNTSATPILGKSFEVRFMQYNNQAANGTIYFDNFYFYSGEAPEYVKEGGAIRNGWVDDKGMVTVNGVEEELSVTRYYQNGLMTYASSKLPGPDGVERNYYINGKDGCVTGTLGYEKTLVATPGAYSGSANFEVSYNDADYETVAIGKGVPGGYAPAINEVNLTGYKFIRFPFYFDQAAIDQAKTDKQNGCAAYFQIQRGNRHHYYLCTGDYDPVTNKTTGLACDYSTFIYGLPSGAKKTGDSLNREVHAVLNGDGTYSIYTHCWDYNGVNVKVNELTAGWTDMDLPLPGGLADRAIQHYDTVELDASGWNMKAGADGANSSWFMNQMPFKLAPVYAYKEISIPVLSAAATGVVGKYLYDNTVTAIQSEGWYTIGDDDYYLNDCAEVLTGIQFIEGVWYDFGEDGICKGTVNGVAETVFYNGVDTTTAPRVFLDGEMQFGVDEIVTVNDNDYLVSSEKTGVIYTDCELVFNATAYLADEDGVITVNEKNGWYELDGDKYYMVNGAAKADTTYRSNGVLYYFGEDGKLVTGYEAGSEEFVRVVADDTIYTANEEGALEEFFGWYEDGDENKYYNHSYYGLAEDLMKIDGEFYFFGPDNVLVTNDWAVEYGMYFGADGKAANGIVENVTPIGSDEPVEYMYFKSGIPCAFETVTDDNLKKVKFDENGLPIQIIDNKGVTIKVIKDGKTTLVAFTDAEAPFTYEVPEFKCYTYAITAEDGTPVDQITVEVLDKPYLFILTYTALELDAHNWDDGVTKKEPSCGIAGIIVYTCEDCGMTKTADIPALSEHTWSEWSELKAPTCVNEGVNYRRCSGCGAIETGAIPVVGHVYDTDPDVEIAATCKDDGIQVFTCISCGKTKTVITPATGVHTFEEGTETVISASTCAVKGLAIDTCKVCKELITKELPLADHKDEDLVEITVYQRPENCVTPGHIYYQCSCCGTFIDDDNVLGEHAYVEDYDTSEEGHRQWCPICESYSEYEAHDPVDITTYADSSCTQVGTTAGSKCSICEYVIEEAEEIGLKDHVVDETTYIFDAEGHWYACANCTTKIQFAAHSLEDVDWVIDETGHEGTHMRYCTVCENDIYIPHDWDMDNLEDVDLEEGTATGTCLTCAAIGTVQIDTWWEPLGLIRSGETPDYTYKLATPVLGDIKYLGGEDIPFSGIYYFDMDGNLVQSDFASKGFNALAGGSMINIDTYGAIIYAHAAVTESGNAYWIDTSELVTGPIDDGDDKYFAEEDGRLVSGYYLWESLDGAYHIFDIDNYKYVRACSNEIVLVDGNEITVDVDGKPVTSGFVTVGGATFYLNEDGTYATGLQTIGDDTYYFYSMGVMAKDAYVVVEGVTLHFGTDGKAELN